VKIALYAGAESCHGSGELELIEEERSPRCITHPVAFSQEKPR